MKGIILNLGQEISKVNKELGEWFNKEKSKYSDLPFELGDIRHADVTEGYRNKCEFTVGTELH